MVASVSEESVLLLILVIEFLWDFADLEHEQAYGTNTYQTRSARWVEDGI
jgi:hypothetical protein